MKKKKSKPRIPPLIRKSRARSIVHRDISKATDAFIKAFEEEEEYLSKLEEEKIREEEEKMRISAQVDYNREAYYEANKLGALDKLKAYLVTFKDHPNLMYISFALTADKARAEAQRYIRDTFYAGYSIDGCPVSLKETRTKRMKDLDKYKRLGKVPIPDLMKAGLTFRCSSCGSVELGYQDYAAKRCFIVEGEGDLNPYTNGYVFCYHCYKKYFS